MSDIDSCLYMVIEYHKVSIYWEGTYCVWEGEKCMQQHFVMLNFICHNEAHSAIELQWRSYTGAHWGLCPTVSFLGSTVSKCSKSRDSTHCNFSQRYHADFYMKIIIAGTIPCYFAITNISGQRK